MIAIISDVHSNIEALKAVVNDMGEVDEIWSLGDLVGYGPKPNEVLDFVKEKITLKVAGNHDLGSVGQMDLAAFTKDSANVCKYTDGLLSLKNRNYLKSLSFVEITDFCTLTHGSPRDPVWEYILNKDAAFENFEYYKTPVCFVGHTHIPVIYQNKEPFVIIPAKGQQINIGTAKMIVNPGSIGQPRDGNPKSSYILLDSENLRITFKRVDYSVGDTQAQMREAKLPNSLIERLANGL